MATLAARSTKDGHWPNLETILMIEMSIKEADIPPRRTELWKSLPRRMMYQTFRKALDYLEASGKVIVDRNERLVWVAVDNPKLQALFESAVRIR